MEYYLWDQQEQKYIGKYGDINAVFHVVGILISYLGAELCQSKFVITDKPTNKNKANVEYSADLTFQRGMQFYDKTIAHRRWQYRNGLVSSFAQ